MPAPQLTVAAPAVLIEGELGVDIGAKVTFGPGIKNAFASVGAGIGVELIPIAGRAKVSLGKNACAELSVGGKATLFLNVEAFVDTFLLKAGKKATVNLFTIELKYPIPSYQLGKCG